MCRLDWRPKLFELPALVSCLLNWKSSLVPRPFLPSVVFSTSDKCWVKTPGDEAIGSLHIQMKAQLVVTRCPHFCTPVAGVL